MAKDKDYGRRMAQLGNAVAACRRAGDEAPAFVARWVTGEERPSRRVKVGDIVHVTKVAGHSCAMNCRVTRTYGPDDCGFDCDYIDGQQPQGPHHASILKTNITFGSGSILNGKTVYVIRAESRPVLPAWCKVGALVKPIHVEGETPWCAGVIGWPCRITKIEGTKVTADYEGTPPAPRGGGCYAPYTSYAPWKP